MKSNFSCVGVDFSPTHFAAVRGVNVNSKIVFSPPFIFGSCVKRDWEDLGKDYHIIELKKTKLEKEKKELQKISYLFFAEMFVNKLLNTFGIDSNLVYCVENYAYGAHSSSVHIIAETTGVLLYLLLKNGATVRTIDPRSLKSWMNADLSKTGMREAIKKEGFIPPKSLFREKEEKDVKGVGTDLVDAACLAHLGITEMMVRRNPSYMNTLPLYQKGVFNRVSSVYEVNLLSRPYLCVL